MVISDAVIVDSELKSVFNSHFELNQTRKGFLINFLKTRYIGACMAFHRKILDKALPFPKNHRLCAHDYWLTVIGEGYYKVVLESTPLIKYRRHSENASTGGGKSPNSIAKRVKVRFYVLYELIKRAF